MNAKVLSDVFVRSAKHAFKVDLTSANLLPEYAVLPYFWVLIIILPVADKIKIISL